MSPRAKRLTCGSCKAPLPGPYGTPGVSLDRSDNTTLLCSTCGRDQGLADWASSTARGFGSVDRPPRRRESP